MAILSTINTTWTDLGLNLVLHGERAATKRLRNGTAHFRTELWNMILVTQICQASELYSRIMFSFCF